MLSHFLYNHPVSRAADAAADKIEYSRARPYVYDQNFYWGWKGGGLGGVGVKDA